MNHDEFVGWLDNEVAAGRMLLLQRQDLLDQKNYFDAERETILLEFRGWIVGFVAGERFVSNDIHDLLTRMKSQYENRMLYFEPVGFDLF